MLPEPMASDQAHESRIKPLRWLRAELAGFGLPATVMPYVTGPQLRVHRHGTPDLVVTVGHRDGAWCYVWGDVETTHPLADPAGCARRIATSLRHQRGL